MKFTIEEMVEGAMNMLADAHPKDRKAFVDSKFYDLISYHTSFGKSIRNRYSLWEHKWTPELTDGIDYSPEHPDAISMIVIETLWKKLNPEAVLTK